MNNLKPKVERITARQINLCLTPTVNKLLVEFAESVEEMLAGPPGQELPRQGPFVVFAENGTQVHHYREEDSTDNMADRQREERVREEYPSTAPTWGRNAKPAMK